MISERTRKPLRTRISGGCQRLHKIIACNVASAIASNGWLVSLVYVGKYLQCCQYYSFQWLDGSPSICWKILAMLPVQ